MAYRYVFPACPAEMLPTRRLKLWKCPSQVCYVYDRLVSISVHLVFVYCLSGGGVLVLNHDRMASFSRQDGNIIGQDEKSDRQAVEIHNRTVEPRSGYRVIEGQ